MRRAPFLQGVPILIVEDDPLQGIDIAESMKDAGASVIGPVASLDEAVSLAEADVCSAAIMDFRLGEDDALPLAEALYRHHTPFIIHTGYDCRPVLPQQWRGCRLIFKPASIESLVQTIAALLRWRRATPDVEPVGRE